MPHIIKNDKIAITLDLPGENYQAARFDWSGKIVQLKFEGLSLHGLEELNGKSKASIGRGFYNEFGIDTALGFGETLIGDYFHKIGVGLLKKDRDNYTFDHDYEIKAWPFAIQKDLQSIQFECESERVNGYAYFLKKKISLLENGFLIEYYLENTGTKSIITDEYNHNFISINQGLLGEDDYLKFSFELKPAELGESINPDGVLSFDKQVVSFRTTPPDVFFFSHLSGGEKVPAHWRLENHKTKLYIQERGDFQTSKVNLWGRGHVISPELFYTIDLKAGESCTWSRTYEIARL